MVPEARDKLVEQLSQAEEKLEKWRKKVTELRRHMQPSQISDYSFKTPDGKTVALSDLFGDKNDLIIIHNMGKKCPYCTLWADGFNGVHQHLENRAGFAVVSPDPPEVVGEFAGGRGWKFRILSNDGGPFTKEMGYEGDRGEPHPGISTFRRETDGRIHRVTHAPFGPGDDFCSLWHMFDMLEGGSEGWQPRYEY